MAESGPTPDVATRPRHPLGPLADVVIAAVLVAVIGVLLGSARAQQSIMIPSMQLPVALAAAAMGAAAAILAAVASRLLGDRRPAWIAAALVLYGVIILPWSTVAPDTTPGLAQQASLPMALAVLGGWTAAGTAFVVDGARHRSAPRLRLGLGLGVLAFAQLPRIVSAPLGIATGNVVSAVVSLVGLGVVLIALTQLVLRALGDRRAEQWQQEEDLAAAALSVELVAELAAERDHELRNGLAGLAGITHLLSAENDSAGHDNAENADIDHVRLEHAVLSELGRLHLILDGGGTEPDGRDRLGPETDYLVEPVLSGLVTLRRSAGERLQLHVEPGLRARGRSAALAQVVTNLLSNCDRHAPGVPVTVAARAGSDGVVVEVRDTGPGLAKGSEDRVLDRGVHDESAGGSGLGLHISRRLVAREGGSLTLRTLGSPRGCLATVTVPLGDGSAQRSPIFAPIAVPLTRRSHHPSHPASAAVRTAVPPGGKPSNR